MLTEVTEAYNTNRLYSLQMYVMIIPTCYERPCCLYQLVFCIANNQAIEVFVYMHLHLNKYFCSLVIGCTAYTVGMQHVVTTDYEVPCLGSMRGRVCFA